MDIVRMVRPMNTHIAIGDGIVSFGEVGADARPISGGR